MFASARRVVAFVLERFPIHLNGIFGVASFYSLYFLWQVLRGAPTLRWTAASVVGALTITGMLLLLRVFDELKDQETDRRLFPDRPLAAGRVTSKDLHGLAWVLAASMTAANLLLGWVAWVFLGLLVFAVLMYRWFFLPRLLSGNIVLALLTHQPYVPLSCAYVACVAARDLGDAGADGRGALAVLMFWAPFAGWEISRKIRAPGTETDYQTYSKVLGARTAATICLALAAITGGALVALAAPLGPSFVFTGVEAAGVGAAAVACARFIARPSERRAKLEPWMDGLLLALHLGWILELTSRRGVAIG